MEHNIVSDTFTISAVQVSKHGRSVCSGREFAVVEKSAANFPIAVTITSIMGTEDPIACWHPVIQTKEAAIWFRGGTAEISCREWPGAGGQKPVEREEGKEKY